MMEQNNRQTELMDTATSEYLLLISKQLLLSVKEIGTVLSLRERFPSSKKLQELASRAEAERSEVERMYGYLNEPNSWFHRLLLKATTLTEAELESIRVMDENDIPMADTLGRQFLNRVKAWYQSGAKAPVLESENAPTETVKRKKANADAPSAVTADGGMEEGADVE